MDTQALKAVRQARGWTQSQLATEVGVSLQTVQAWEQGRNPIPKWAVKALERIHAT